MELPARFGVYELLKLLGSGSFGEVFLARPLKHRRGVPEPVVIKRLHAHLADDVRLVQRFSHEAELAVSVDSPFVAKVYDAGIVDRTLFIAFEYIAGWPLVDVINDLLLSRRELSLASFADIADDGLRGLAALHGARDRSGRSLGIVHRDIAPKNVILGEDGRARLIDLGIGKSRLQPFKTTTGAIIGTPGYMAPEQIRAEKVDHRADLYAFGVVLHELLTREAFIPQGPMAMMLGATLQRPYRAASLVRRDVPPQLDRVLERALAPKAADRFASAEEFRVAIRRVLPEQADREKMSTLIGGMMWGELTRTKTDLSTRLAVAPSSGEAETVPARTVLFAVRANVEISAEVDPTYVPRAPRRARAIARISAAIVAALALIALGVGLERLRLHETPAPVRAVEQPAPARVEAVPRAIATEPQPEEPAVKQPAKRAAKKLEPVPREHAGDAPPTVESPPPRMVEPPPPPVERPPPRMVEPPPPAPVSLDDLLLRARAMREATADASPERAKIDEILAALLRLRTSMRVEADDPRVRRLASELDRLRPQH